MRGSISGGNGGTAHVSGDNGYYNLFFLDTLSDFRVLNSSQYLALRAGLMRPVTLGMLLTMIIFWIVTMACTVPGWLLGLLVSPILSRGTLLIEFLYPLPIARWGHLLILRWSKPKATLTEKASNYHSRTLEQRVEVVKGRVWLHPIPQFLDNLGYLVVCLPPPPNKPHVEETYAGETPLGKVSVTHQYEPDEDKAPKGHIVAFLVDCGDAETVNEQVQLIREAHYRAYPSIQIHMVLSTHKHHDHTAGNEALKTQKAGRHLEHIVGGAVERVPGCNLPVADGDILKLPICGKNNMNDAVYVEVVAVPAHTRGSVVYILRPTNNNSINNQAASDLPGTPCFVFTGDTMFSGGGGVPFEAGSDSEVENGTYRDNAHGAIRAGVGSHAVERCFAEILVRGTMTTDNNTLENAGVAQDQFIIFPGHEYTVELLSRQFGVPPSGNVSDANKWKNFPPSYFFETVSELYVSLHRRTLPQATGKVLSAAPTTLRREMAINPHLRSLARRAELVVHAIQLWDAYFCKPKTPKDEEARVMRMRNVASKVDRADNQGSLTKMPARQQGLSNKTLGTEKSWNMDTRDAAKTVFTTVYTSDLDAVINALTKGKLDPDEAALKLEGLKTKLQEPVIRRRPIPGTLPSERVVFKGLIGFALLVSSFPTHSFAMSLRERHVSETKIPSLYRCFRDQDQVQ
jgi:glyoxylase-like metal-dependent hydrolase (beta-lactamase superfamily II)